MTAFGSMPFGATRSTVQRDHAIFAPDSHIRTALPSWTETDGFLFISPQLGSMTRARFSQYIAIMQPGAKAGPPLPGIERFVFVIEGTIHVQTATEAKRLTLGGYAFLPADTKHNLVAESTTRINVFEKPYSTLVGAESPTVVMGQEQEVEAVEFLGDPDLLLRTLLPDTPSFDMAVNIMHYNPGATLPMVEVHMMEHGLLMLQGQGIQRLAECWYPIQDGDVVWMAPYCPQWFVGMGKEPARYLLYKDMNRDPLALDS
ncbi:MAG: (S)-ureidoglycine aminohydrolase [Chloroflexota bacterium]